jgi:putative methyltransferase (TIGR04325 family)
MKPLYRVHRLIEHLSESLPWRPILERRYEREFAENRTANLFRGVFDSFAVAQESAPSSRPVGYDNSDAASMYMNRTEKIFPADYPIMFWLTKLLTHNQGRVLDLGGHIGVSYYAYRNYIRYPKGLRWTVHDVPAVMARGRELAREMDNTGQLDFCDTFEACNDADVVMALGSLQYLPDTLPERLTKLNRLPRNLLLNLVPIHMQHSYYTLQSIGTTFCPYRIFAKAAFIGAFETLGYTLVDCWENPEKSCVIPFHPEHSLDRYYGFLFSRPEHP